MLGALFFVAVLLIGGILLRLRFSVFQYVYIPAAIFAGGIGLLLVQLPQLAPIPGWANLEWVSQELTRWPSFLIAVVFASLLLERQDTSNSSRKGNVVQQVIMVWIIVLGQTFVGLVVTALLIQPFYTVPNSFGMLLETGFAGGHGTAAAMGQVFSHPTVGLATGQDLGILMATAGLVYGTVSGLLWIQVGRRRGWLPQDPSPSRHAEITSIPQESRHSIGYEVLPRTVVDPLLLQLIWLTIAVAIGYLLQWCCVGLASLFDSIWWGDDITKQENYLLTSRLKLAGITGSFPLFIFTLFGGWIVRTVLRGLRLDLWIEPLTLRRLAAVAMDILVVAAITSLNLQAVAKMMVPFTILLAAGLVWTPFCLFILARRILPATHWFQLGLVNYGMSTGTTATGMVLLRMADADMKTSAAEEYALAAPFSAPFIGGGMLTVALPLLALERVPIALSVIALGSVLLGMIVVGVRRGSRLRNKLGQ